MKLWKIIKALCTQCLFESKKSGLDVHVDDCVQVGNTILCTYHLREMQDDFERYLNNKSK
jgi:Zn ribbon nucleic-acid-binding protein